MPSLNRVELLGRLTRDPELRFTPSGAAVCHFALATNSYRLDPNGQRREQTDYHQIVAWSTGNQKLGERVAEYLRKGSLVYLEGRLQTRSWEDKEGQKRQTTEAVANSVQFLDGEARTAMVDEGADEGPAF